MISVVIPVYNGADVLPTTVPAVAALDGVGEVIYVDDGSTDGTGAILARADHARTVTLAENQGRSAARNAGVAAARGDVLVFFDADVEPPASAAQALAAGSIEDGAVASVSRLDPVLTAPTEAFQDYVWVITRGARPWRPARATDWTGGTSSLARARSVATPSITRADFRTSVPYGEDVALACRLSGVAPDGLRLADATVRLHDLGDLDRALRTRSPVRGRRGRVLRTL